MSAQREKRTIDYFRRGQVLFLVDGKWDEASAQELLSWARPIAAEAGVTINISRQPVIFPSVQDLLEPPQEGEGPQGPVFQGLDINQGTLSLSSIETAERKKPYTSPAISEEGSFALVSADVPELADIPEPGTPGRATKLSQDASNLLDLIRTMDGARGNVFGGTRLQVVSPNWLASGGASSPGGTGGPGGRPVSYDGPANTEEYKIHADLDDVWLNGILDIPDDQRGKDVVVAILDTAPTKDVFPPDPGEKWAIQRAGVGPVLTTIYDRWVTQRQFNPPDPHPLINGLMNPADPRLTVYLHPDVDRYDPNIEGDGYMQTRRHDYEMTDHGLFVAGLIHSLAPQAQIHLYQVLNRYGVGDLVTIADALLDVYLKFARGLLVVNLSLNINIPLVDEHRQHDDDDDDDDDDDEMGRSLIDFKKTDEKKEADSWSVRQKLAAERICALALAIGSRVIAAAGNNRKQIPQSFRPEACYPAALESVLGVGALPKGKKPTNPLKTASYSNRSDRPEYTGITTLGGERGKKKGVLGIYLAEFPHREEEDEPDDEEHRNRKTPSKYGWGWWAGTSFATPIISGITAALLSSMPGSKTEDAIVQLFAGQTHITDANEDVLFVTQGLP